MRIIEFLNLSLVLQQLFIMNFKIPNKRNPQNCKTKSIRQQQVYYRKNFNGIKQTDKRWSIRIARYFNPSNHASRVIQEDSKGIPNNLVPIVKSLKN